MLKETVCRQPDRFSIDVTVRIEHYSRSQSIAKLEALKIGYPEPLVTIENSPIALAVRDRLQALCIPCFALYVVQDQNIGSYTELYTSYKNKGKLYLFQADHPKELRDAYSGSILAPSEFRLDFRLSREFATLTD